MIAGCVIEPCQTAVGLQPSAHMRSACASSATAALWPCAWLLVAAPRHSVAPMRAAPFVSVQESRATHGACCLCCQEPALWHGHGLPLHPPASALFAQPCPEAHGEDIITAEQWQHASPAACTHVRTSAEQDQHCAHAARVAPPRTAVHASLDTRQVQTVETPRKTCAS